MSYFERTQIQASDSPSVDAFGRWRVSNPKTLFDGRTGDNETRVWSDILISGTLTSLSNANRASLTMTTTANTAGKRVRQSLKRFNYTPGKSQLIMCSFVMGAAVGGNKKKVGYFDDRNGLFLQQDGSEVSFNRRTYTSGAVVDNKTVQADWNLDKFDGTGPSGITLDLSKTQIIVIDLEWLGVGRVRLGFNVDGVTYYVHEMLNTNNLALVYMTTGSLPVRYEMEHSGSGASSTLECVCSTVISEGGAEPIGSPGGISNGVVTGINTGSGYVLFSLRLQSSKVYAPVVKLTGFDIVGTTNNDGFAWYILRDPTVTGTLTYGAVSNSPIELAAGDNSQKVTVSAEDIIATGVGYSRAAVSVMGGDDLQLEVYADAVAVPACLAIVPFTNMQVTASVRWRHFA